MRFNKNIVLTMCAASAAFSIFHVRAEERDPFVSILDLQQQKMKVDLSGVVLKGIIWEAGRQVAILNDTLVTTGEDFFGFKVVSIAKDKVTLTMGKESYVLDIENAPLQGSADSGQEGGQNQQQTNTFFPPPPIPGSVRPYEDPTPNI